MSRYAINILASRDLNEIADYFAENNLAAGDLFFQAFNRKCQHSIKLAQYKNTPTEKLLTIQ
jgi:toxin ParE1/3/4